MISLTTKYGLSALLYLAKTKGDEFVSIDILAKESDVPSPYLSKLMKTLASKELVLSKKGLGGGFKLNPKKKKLSFLDVCVALDDPITKDSCFLGKKVCSGATACAVHSDWISMKGEMLKFLGDSKLRD